MPSPRPLTRRGLHDLSAHVMQYAIPCMLRETAKRKRDRILLLTACHKTDFHRWLAEYSGVLVQRRQRARQGTHSGRTAYEWRVRRVLKALSTASLLATVLSTAWFGRIRTYVHTYIHTYIHTYMHTLVHLHLGKISSSPCHALPSQILKFSLHAAAPQDGVCLAKFI